MDEMTIYQRTTRIDEAMFFGSLFVCIATEDVAFASRSVSAAVGVTLSVQKRAAPWASKQGPG
jgi:hypothetical protein